MGWYSATKRHKDKGCTISAHPFFYAVSQLPTPMLLLSGIELLRLVGTVLAVKSRAQQLHLGLTLSSLSGLDVVVHRDAFRSLALFHNSIVWQQR